MNKLTFLVATLFCVVVNNVSADEAALKQKVEAYKSLIADATRVLVAKNESEYQNVLSKMDEATNLGIEIANGVAERDSEGKELLGFLVSNVDKMKGSNLETIEEDWHHASAFPENLNHDDFDHYGPVIAAKDSVIHPITAKLAIQEFQKDKNSEHIEQAAEELKEIAGQIKYIFKS